jgi:membrane protease YdiL (CAAX protease family)
MPSTTAFVLISYALSISLSLIIGFSGGHDSSLIRLGYLSMFIPAIAVLAISFKFHDFPKISWSCFPGRYLVIALFLMPLAMHAVMLPLVFWSEGTLPWSAWLSHPSNGLYQSPTTLGWREMTKYQLVSRIVLNAIVGLGVVSFLAFFEEIGWRGWFLPRLFGHFSARMAIVITSAIWSLWHLPFIVAGIQYVAGISVASLSLVLPVGVFGSGLVLGWLWLRTKSIWIVALAHGSLNNWGQFVFKYMEISNAAESLRLLLAGALILVFVGILLLSLAMPHQKTIVATSAGC